jgi:hypothetical protein
VPVEQVAALVTRFWSKVEKQTAVTVSNVTSPCWLWKGTKTNTGYGQIGLGGRTQTTHRVSWFLAHGQWPRLCVLHKCDVPACVNPEHLFEGTKADNARDMSRKGRCWQRRKPERIISGDLHYARLSPELLARGDDNGNSKLSEAQALQIIVRKRSGERHVDIARDFGIAKSQVSNIGRTQWKHLLAPAVGM